MNLVHFKAATRNFIPFSLLILAAPVKKVEVFSLVL